MKLLTYRPRVQSVGASQQVSVASGALWDLVGRASMYQRSRLLVLRRWNRLLVLRPWTPVPVHRVLKVVVVHRVT